MRSPRFSLDAIPVQYWNEVYRDCALIDAVREVAEELKKSREKVPSDFVALMEALELAKGALANGSTIDQRYETYKIVCAALADGKEGGE